ncbi:MAG: hypothetical protein ACWA5P_01765 [bacterium]
MNTLTIYFCNGEILRHHTKGTIPQLRRAFYLGRSVGNKIIRSLTIEKKLS